MIKNDGGVSVNDTHTVIPPQKPLRGVWGGFSLSKRIRLRLSRDFTRVQKQGWRIHSESLILIVRPTRPFAGKVGFTVSKQVGKANIRNKVKRRLRHIIRHYKGHFTHYEIILLAQPSITKLTFAELQANVLFLLQKLAEKTQKNQIKNAAPTTGQQKLDAHKADSHKIETQKIEPKQTVTAHSSLHSSSHPPQPPLAPLLPTQPAPLPPQDLAESPPDPALQTHTSSSKTHI